MNSNLKIAGPALPDMPWEERPAGSKEVLWRYSANPIIPRNLLSTSNSIFNSAVVPFKNGKYNYAGVFRCDDTSASRSTASTGTSRRRISTSRVPTPKWGSGSTAMTRVWPKSTTSTT